VLRKLTKIFSYVLKVEMYVPTGVLVLLMQLLTGMLDFFANAVQVFHGSHGVKKMIVDKFVDAYLHNSYENSRNY
jgi:hypothetical protein